MTKTMKCNVWNVVHGLYNLLCSISQQVDNDESMSLGKIDPTQHPEYTSLMKELDQSKLERLQRIENWQKFERQSIHDWFAAQKKQAWNDFYVSINFSFASERGDLHFCVMNYPSPPLFQMGGKPFLLQYDVAHFCI